MNHETKLKILQMLHELPLDVIKQQADKCNNLDDRYFWDSLYRIERRQRA